jgi:hypothetical protein
MPLFKLNLFPRVRQRQRTELSGTTYELVFTWRERTEALYVDVYELDGTPVVLGRRVRPASDALTGVLDIPGVLLGAGPDTIQPEDIGERFFVGYVTQ